MTDRPTIALFSLAGFLVVLALLGSQLAVGGHAAPARPREVLTLRDGDSLDLTADRVILTGELHAKCHHDAGDVTSAKDGVAACQRQQLSDWIGLLRSWRANLSHPVLIHLAITGKLNTDLFVDAIERAMYVAGLRRELRLVGRMSPDEARRGWTPDRSWQVSDLSP